MRLGRYVLVPLGLLQSDVQIALIAWISLDNPQKDSYFICTTHFFQIFEHVVPLCIYLHNKRLIKITIEKTIGVP